MATSSGQTIYAILYETGELHFQYGNTVDLTKGMPNGKYQVASAYSDNSSVPWYRKSVLITKVTSDAISCSTSGIVSTAHWFNNCSKLTSLDLSKLDTSGVTNMSGMFSSCYNLTSLDLSKLNTSSVTNMSSMFSNCSSLTNLNVSGFDTSRVTDMSYMFSNCYKLTSLNVSKFNTSRVTNMSSIFSSCYALTSLDVSKFNTSSVTNMSSMFSSCSSLTNLNISGFDTSKVTYTGFMFNNCSSLTSLDLSKFNTSRVTYTGFMFYGCSSLTSLDVSKFNTSMVTSMNSMFSYCSSLTNLNVSKFNTSNVTNMGDMFSYCSSLTSLDLSKFDTRNVTDMSYMFRNCSKLTSLDVSKFNTSKVTSMNLIFYNCSKLTNLNLSSFDTSKVTNMGSMFYGCSSITSLTIGPSTKLASNAKLLSQDWIQKSATKKVTTDDIYTFTASNHAKETFEKFVSYSISYNLNGGNISGNPSSYTQLDTFTLPTPTRNNYTFTGWTGTGLSSATKSVTISKGSTGNRSYTANWSANGYTVSFNYNKPSTATGTMSGNGTTSKGVTYAAAYGNLPQPSIPGWTFNGWYTAASGGSRISATTTYTTTGNQTLYAHWTINTYSISYNTNGGSLSGQKTSYNVNTDSFTLPQPTRTGYTFTGWTGSNGTTAQKSITITKGSTGNKNYTANWSINSYYLDLNGWLSGSLSGDLGSHGTCDVYINNVLIADNCTDFYKQIPYGSKWEIKDIKATTGHYYNGVHSGSLTGTIGASNATVVLDFSAKKTTVTFYRNINSSDTTTAVQTFTYGVSGQSFSDKKWTKTGYTLLGWAETRNATAQKYSTLSPVVDGWINEKTPQASSNVTLYAVWSRNNYSISYTLNGGSISGQPTSYNVESANFTLPTPTRNGYTFTGWTGTGLSELTKTVTVNKGSTGNRNYTANWSINTYSIGYALNGGSLSGQPTNYNVETATFTLPTPSKSGYTFTGWTGTGLLGLTKTVTVSKNSTGNRNYTAHFEKTVNATFKYYNNQTVTVAGKITDSETSVAVKAPSASGTPQGYTFRGWSTNSAANASVNAAASASITISANVTYYASYSKNVTATFYYCTLAADNYTYANGAQKSAAASATQYLGYAGAVVNSNIAIPSAVAASHGGASAQNYIGVSKDTNSVSTVTPTTAYTKYYAVYTEPLKFHYYNGTNDASTSVTRRMLSNGSTYSDSLSASAPTPAAYDGAAFAWWSCESGVSSSSSLRRPLETGVNNLYAVYKKNVSISYNANGGSGAPAVQSGIKYYAKKESGNNITNPSITVTGSKPSRSGYNFNSWNTSANGNGTVYKAGTAYTVSANVTVYAHWTPITWTTKYDANGGNGTMADTIHRFNCGDKIRHNQFTRPGWTMTGWTISRVRNGITEWHYGTSDGHWINGHSWYKLGQNPPGTSLWIEHKLDTADNSSTYINGDVHTMHAQWSYNPVSVKVPQVLTGNHTGKSQFRVKCDDLKAGNIKVTVPNSFLYKQAGKADITAAITAKSGNNIITPSNKVCVYNITTTNGLSAGCWQGSFNIGLTLTKE